MQNPSKIKYLPSFLYEEYLLLKGSTNRCIDNICCKFLYDSLVEHERIEGLKDEENVIRDIMNNVNPDDTFYDVEANIGTHSCFLGKRCSEVVAFEPFSENFKSLRRNLAANSIKFEAYELALMDYNSSISLEKKSDKPGEGQISVSENDRGNIESIRADDLIEEENLQYPNVMKIDIEGAEFRAIKGMSNILDSGKVKLIYIEVHPDRIEDYGGTKEDLEEFIEQKGYETRYLADRNSEKHLKAVKK